MARCRIVSIVALWALLGVAAPAFAGPTLHVPGDHSTIQAAIDAAGPGDKIVIGPGIYNESVVVDVPRVRLIARDGLHTVIVDGAGLGSVDGITITADGVELRGLVVRNFSEYVGPGVVDFRVGILVNGGHRCRLVSNLAHSNGDGIVLREASHCMLRRNTARNNIHNGIFLRNESWGNRVQHNVAVDNGPDRNPAPDFVPAGVGCGVQLSFEANDNQIVGNSLSGNGRGLQLDRGSTANEAKKNVSTNNSRFGIAALAVGGQPAAAGNVLKQNAALANGEFDLIDDGSPAVGNLWKNNEFETSNF